MIKKLLIANRGEIVRRIIKACRDLGIRTVAVYSDADKDAFYLKRADEVYHIGPSNPMKSYLNIEAIMDVVKRSGSDAVHPGYGFLSENFAFADAVVSNNVIWVGPSPTVLKNIESKCYCREVATGAGVPVVPGTIVPVTNTGEILQFASRYGYPIVLKLDKGGGGKGIQVVRREEKVPKAFEELSRIGLMAFNSPDCYIEKEVVNPRHIEIQFMTDRSGNGICLGERECSIQRRYQKIIEESPSPVVTVEDRKKLYGYTLKLARAMGYEGAGTMEFLRSEDGEYYFMEINARLQVEHPVTEFVTGIDIVKSQLQIASGNQLKTGQDDIHLKGHAIEARVYAEDPVSFVPSPGSIKALRLPKTINGYLRIDHAMEEGGNVPPYYDPLLAKVIAWGDTREETIDRLKEALVEFQVEGIKTTISTNLKILEHKKFRQGNFTTAFIEELNED